MLVWVALSVLGWRGNNVRFFCGDETRLGLKTIGGRKITAKGVKPVGQVQWQFKATYIYGIVEPQTGEHFFFEFSAEGGQRSPSFLQSWEPSTSTPTASKSFSILNSSRMTC